MKKRSEEPKGHGAKYPQKKEQAIVALMRCETIQGAAAMIKVGEKTLRRWLKLPSFKRAYDEAVQRATNQTMDALMMAGPKAVETLVYEMTGDHGLAAAKYVLDKIFKLQELQAEKAEQDEPVTAGQSSLATGKQGDETEGCPDQTRTQVCGLQKNTHPMNGGDSQMTADDRR